MELTGKRVVVVGLGKSGVAAAKLCLARGARVTGTDSAPVEKLSPEARTLGVELVLNGHAQAGLASAHLIVVSPGVPDFPELLQAELSGVEVIGELELATRFIDAPIVAIGGTNGKSTTTTLIGDMFTAGGLKAFVGGNLGTPLLKPSAWSATWWCWRSRAFSWNARPCSSLGSAYCSISARITSIGTRAFWLTRRPRATPLPIRTRMISRSCPKGTPIAMPRPSAVRPKYCASVPMATTSFQGAP